MTKQVPEPEQLVHQVAALFRAERVFTSILDSDLKKTGLTLREVYILTLLTDQPKYAMPINDITTAMQCPKSVTTTWIHKLEKRGLVARKEDRTDGRRVNVILTAKGHRAQEIALPLLMRSIVQWFSEHFEAADFEYLTKIDNAIEAAKATHTKWEENRSKN